MKIRKAISAIVAVFALLFGVLPMSALAEGLHIETLTFIKVNVDEPVAGREADFDVGVGALPTNAARVYVEQKDNLHYYRGVGWYDYTDGRYLEEGDCFVAGHEYIVYVAVYVQNYFYQFSSSLEATVNGEQAVVMNGYTTKAVVKYDFGVCKNPPPDITDVTIGGNLRPVAGQAPVFTLAYDHERMEPDLYAGTAFINGVAWYNSNTYSILDESDTFEAGETYTMEMQLKAKGNYRFATEDGESVVKATVEGMEAVNISAQEEDQSRYLKLRVKFVCAETDILGGGAGYIGLDIPYPVAGKKMSYKPTLYGENCEYSYLTEDGFYDGVKWVNRTHGFTYNTSSVFSEGSDYSVTVLVKAKSVLQDETRLRYLLHEDGTVDPYIRATVNGLPARVEPYGDQSPVQVVQVTFDFPACNSTARTIDDITFTDIRTPVVGNTVDTVATVEYGYKENIPTTKKTVELTWVQIDENESESRALTDDDVFEEGYRYVWMVDLSADSLSEFAVEDQQLNVSVRGAVETGSQLVSSKRIMVAALYMPFDSLPDPINRIDIIGAVAPTVGERPYYDASLTEALMPYASITDVTWLENGYIMAENATFKKSNSYSVIYGVETVEPYTFAQTAVIRGSVNGNEMMYNGYDGSTGLDITVSDDGRTASIMWVYGELGNASYTGVTDYVEIGGLMRPAPGQTPDFNVDISSPYTQCGGVTWYELDDNGYRVGALAYDDCFKSDTRYRAEVRVLPSAGRSINLDSRGAVLNGEVSHYYYLPGNAAVVYAEYDTSLCIAEMDVLDVQYPIGGKTPDTNVVIRGVKSDVDTYANGSQIDWYYETNPGTSAAGFSRLDGKFKSDRRHQAYITLRTVGDYWFATDKDGNLVVDTYIDGVPVDVSYVTDTYLDDGAVNKLEAARTFDLAKNADGVFVDGLLLTDGLYLEKNRRGVQTEDTVDKEAGYACYENGVLTLHNFEWDTRGDYDAIASYQPLTVYIEGNNRLTTDCSGINIAKALTLTGDKDAVLGIESNQYGIFVNDTLTINGAQWVIHNQTYDGIWLYSDLTMNDGLLSVYGKTSGIWGDDWPALNVYGGTLLATSSKSDAIAWCNVNVADTARVEVFNSVNGVFENWDGVSDFAEYAGVRITVPDDSDLSVLMGDVNSDGTVDIFDAQALFQYVNEVITADELNLEACDFDGNGEKDIFDAQTLFQYVNEVIDEL